MENENVTMDERTDTQNCENRARTLELLIEYRIVRTSGKVLVWIGVSLLFEVVTYSK